MTHVKCKMRILSRFGSYFVIKRPWASHRNISSLISRPSVALAHKVFNPPNQDTNSPPLILIHGLFGSKKNWESIAKAFSRRRKIITLDCRNHGESGWREDMDYESMAGDVEQLMTSLGVSRAHVLGHSMGGKVAMVLALHRPELIARLIIEDVSPDVSRPVDAPSDVARCLEAMRNVTFDQSLPLTATRRDVNLQLTQVVPNVVIRRFLLTNITEQDGECGWQVNLEAITRGLPQLLAFPDLHLSYPEETLFLGGTESHHIRDEHVGMIRQFFPAALVQHVQGAGHWIHSEKPRQFMQIVQDYLQQT